MSSADLILSGHGGRTPEAKAAIAARSQRRILYIWEQAIGQAGGYFYSRLLLAIIHGALTYGVLLWRGVLAVVPGTAPEKKPPNRPGRRWSRRGRQR